MTGYAEMFTIKMGLKRNVTFSNGELIYDSDKHDYVIKEYKDDNAVVSAKINEVKSSIEKLEKAKELIEKQIASLEEDVAEMQKLLN